MGRYWTALLMGFAAGAFAAPEPSATIWGLELLMQQRATVQSERVSYSEVRKMPSMESTTTSSGVLFYQAPDHLERQTSKPFPERAIIEGGKLTLEIETASGQMRRREFALKDLPGPRPFFIALRAVLSGDLAALRQNFETALEGDEAGWRLKLKPREPADRHIREIVVSGRALEILVIDVRERNGDSSRTTLLPESSEIQPTPPVTPKAAPES